MQKNRLDFKYEIALSFAGEQREYIDKFANELRNSKIRVFYDDFEKAKLWGKDLYQYLNDIYKNQCLFTIVFISKDYALKRWTILEWKSAQTRAFDENKEYILPVRFDETELPGFNKTVGYLNVADLDPRELADLTIEKLTKFGETDPDDLILLPKVSDYKKLTFTEAVNPNDLIGRESNLNTLHRVLSKEQENVVVNGMGGIGKTTLVAAYTFKHYDYYEKIVWISQSHEDVRLDFVQNVQLINNLSIDTNGKSVEQLFEEISSKLSNLQLGSPKLLVIDNAQEGLERYLNQLPAQPEWHLLVTSSEKLEGLIEMKLSFLNEVEASDLFQKHCQSIHSPDEILKLVQIVEYHTLTIEILAKTAERHRLKYEELTLALERNQRTNVKTRHSDFESIENIMSYLKTLFDVSALSEDELWLLVQFHSLPLIFHDYDFLEDLMEFIFEDRESNFAETLNSVVDKGWLLNASNGNEYKLHQIVDKVIDSEFILSYLGNSYLNLRIALLLKEENLHQNPAERLKWIPFAHRLLNTTKVEDESLAALRLNLCIIYTKFGNLQEAIILVELALRWFDKHKASGDTDLLVANSVYGSLLNSLGDFEKSKDVLRKVLFAKEEKYGKDSLETSSDLSNLALALRSLNENKVAKELLLRAINIEEKRIPLSYFELAVRYSNLGLVLQNLKDYSESQKFLEKAIEIEEAHLSKYHPQLANDCSNLGLLQRDIGNIDRAKEWIERSIECDKNNSSKPNFNSTIRLNNLALINSDLGNHRKALEIGAKVLNTFKELVPETHPYIGFSKKNLGYYLEKCNDPKLILEYQNFIE